MSDDSLMRCEENVLHRSSDTAMTAEAIEHEEQLWRHLDGSFTTLYAAPMNLDGRVRYHRSPGRLTAYRDDSPGADHAWVIDSADPVIWLRGDFMALLRRRLIFPMTNGGVVTECHEGHELLYFNFGIQRFIYSIERIVGEADCGDGPHPGDVHGPVWQARWPD